MRSVNRVKHERSAAISQERADRAASQGKAWVAGGGVATASTRGIIADLESDTERSPEGAAGARRAASALNSNLTDA